ncbi:DUF2934 domain-containing protein (plasmid) [Rhizobium leguminosarum]|uniref:DUF2934 domain-containing protein n=1 Tax=Rhizobium leguminosarum TaxID=384 RepID=UPI00102F6F62|nr:DUF2934 domain-containing protein [Rhizobium leguminosarum]TAU74463.1 DUF2934 domain-containing protein [Rhizobium leguminosarum]TAX04636.1 DUF2934 domain-containing protein [Rhizobium leguminosarum]TAY06037.1 DUF2934 domain-containing protein [Rhizobium leguminosarum]TAY08659.1 DUF2934 domain-containing protein [Rhizobium leguminosarum]TAZ03829.1 DUF2934 domain-containing protein [Rhizobium leguminosarum]
MAETRDEWIKKRAYALWEEEGHPTGRDSIHWEQARHERDTLEGSAASSDGKEVKPRAKRSVTGSKTNGGVTPAPKRTASRKTAS